MISTNPTTSTIILIFGLQAVILSVLLIQKRPRKQSNVFLALLLFFFALMSVNIGMASFLFAYDLNHVFRYVQLELLFGFGPALYFFTKSITDPKYRILKKEYIHFIPVVLEFIFYRTAFYRLGSNGMYEIPEHPYTAIYLAEQRLGVISISVYILLSVHLLVKHRQWIKSKYSDLKNKSLGWLRIPVFIYSFFWICWLILSEIDKHIFLNAYREIYFMPTTIGLSVITCWLGFKGYVQSQTEATGFQKACLKAEIVPSNPEQARSITELMNSSKPYLNPELDLQKLSKQFGMPPKTISRIINHDLQMNFYEFVNKYRVEAFKQRMLLENCDQLTLLGHAFECGFNSKSTFNHIFKKNTGYTPREYYLKFKNESEQKHSDDCETSQPYFCS